MGRRRRQSGHGLPIRRRSPAEDASAVELWFDTWYNIRTREDLVTEEQGDDELFGIWPRLHMRAAPRVVIHLETLAYVAAERLWPPCAPRLQVRPGCVELLASMKEIVQLAVIARRDPDATLALRELRERGCSGDQHRCRGDQHSHRAGRLIGCGCGEHERAHHRRSNRASQLQADGHVALSQRRR